jgi:hypothetical protein
MTRKPIMQRIAELEARKKTLVARLGRQERVRDTRRKILLGALVLHRLEQSNNRAFAERLRLWLRAELTGFLIRDGDRLLFDDLLNSLPSSNADRNGEGSAGPEQ